MCLPLLCNVRVTSQFLNTTDSPTAGSCDSMSSKSAALLRQLSIPTHSVQASVSQTADAPAQHLMKQQPGTQFKEQHTDVAQHLLNRHSSPGSFNNTNNNNNHNQSLRGRHPQHGATTPLLTSPSILPGPRYPFPSQGQAAAGGLQGVLRSLLKPFKRCDSQQQHIQASTGSHHGSRCHTCGRAVERTTPNTQPCLPACLPGPLLLPCLDSTNNSAVLQGACAHTTLQLAGLAAGVSALRQMAPDLPHQRIPAGRYKQGAHGGRD